MTEETLTMNYDEIVISGISGRFPESDNMDELKDNLYNHVDMISADDRRWPQGLYGLPTRSGKIKDLSKFDAQFFSVHGKQADLMDPQSRMLLELTYEAIVDAGINPQTLRGTRTGVYIGACVSEVEEGLAKDISKISGYALIGCSRSMFANRVSYTFDFHGPSYSIDTACSSSFLAFQQAVTGLRTNQCDQAIVGGVNICVRPASSLQFHKLSMLSMDGACKHLDESGNGYVRSETCSAILLQRKGDAKRIYATVLNAKTNTDGNKDEGITFPSWTSQRDLMKETVEEAGINPHDVVYVEAHGTGTPAGDPVETRAIAEVFCSNNRPTPLLIGSVKSNLGHAEPASGLNSIAKMLIAFQNESIPANLHFKTPSSKIPELINGIVKPVIENTPFKGGLVAINSFGFGGVNVHLILKPFVKDVPVSVKSIEEKIPRIIPISGRTEDGINYVFDFIEKNPEKVNKEFVQLLTDGLTVTQDNSGLNVRGYMLADKHPTGDVTFTREVSRLGEKRPIWFVYSGMGSQWPQMARGLLSIDIFRQSLERSAATLSKHGIDLMDIVTGDNADILDTPVASCVAIAAIQIAMTDVLRAVGIVPDGIVGHSVGELGCAYGDGILTPEEMILAAYWRGKCVQDGNLPLGLMAAVGLTWDDAKKRCPEGVVPACYNAHDSVTISGSYNECQSFVKQLQLENVFAREVKSCGIAFHSQFMKKIGPSLLEKLQEIIPERRERSPRWISSSFPQSEWNTDDAKYSGPYYFVHNLTSQVLFHDAVQFVPKNAIVIEIAPHCLMQPIVKRTLGADISYISLAKRGNIDGNLAMFTGALGKLFNLGVAVDYSPLYSRIEYPVSHSIQSISSLVKWDHSQSWLVTNYPEYFNPNTSSEYSVKIDLSEKDCEFYAGHVIDGRILFPATGYLFLVWEMLAKTKGQSWDKVPVEFENVTLHRATIVPKEGQVKFDIRMMEVNGEFALSEGGNVVVTGRVFQPEKSPLRLQQILHDGSVVSSKDSILMTPRDAYKELRLRGYDYHTKFQAIAEAYSDSTHGKLSFHNWVILADTMLQIGILGKPTRGLYLPVRFQSVRCDPEVLLAAIDDAKTKLQDPETELPQLHVINDSRISATVVPGLEIHGLKVNLAPRRANAQIATLEKYVFMPYTDVNILENSSSQEMLISDYIRVTSALAQKFAQTNPKLKEHFPTNITVEPGLLQEYSDGNNAEHVLVRILRESSIDSLKTLLAKYQTGELGEDLLGKLYENQNYIRPALELVVENRTASKLNIVEANRTDRMMNEVVRNYIDAAGYAINLNYTVLHSDKIQPDLGPNNETKVWNKSTIPFEQNTVDLLVYKDTLGYKIGSETLDFGEFLESASNTVKANGFLMAVFRSVVTPAEKMLYSLSNESIDDSAKRITEFRHEARANCFELVSERTDSLSTTVLLFRLIEINPAPSEQTVIEITNTGFKDWLEPLKMALAENAGQGANIWLIGRDTPDNGLVGLVKCLRQEPGGNRVHCILHSNSDSTKKNDSIDFGKPEYARILKHSMVLNVIRDGHVGTFRHMDLGPVDEELIPTEHAFLNVATRGDLSSLKWYQAAHQYWQQIPAKYRPDGEQLCTVYYAPLNFRDIMLATGKLPPDALPGDLALQDCILGLEFAGRDAAGKRVMGVLAARGLATTVIVDDPQFLWEIPDKWTMEEASTVPVAYSTAYYALVVRGELEPNESILIHSGSGGVGQAAIAIALSMNCTVFTTVGSDEKKNYLKSRFPQLSEKNFANSRDLSFEQHILRETGGRGVDMVLNSLAEEKLQASVRCLAQHGRFLEIGKYDLSQNNPLGMAAFLKNIAFHGILLDALFGAVAPTPMIAAHKRQVAELLTHGIKSGAVRPLKSTSFDMDQTEEAFRFMATGKHIGKVVLKIRDEEKDSVCVPVIRKVMAVPRTVLSPIKSYIVTGGLGGFGLELSQWLAERGARELVLTSRSGPRDAYQHYVMKKLREMGVNVVISKADPATIEGAEKLIKDASIHYPIGGLFNLAMVLADGFIENQTAEAFEKVAHTKIVGNQNLDKVTRKMCPEMDYFVAFSSVSCGRGNAGQTNYGFANSSMERVCERRRADGLHGLAIQWGAIGDVGVVSENMGGNDVVIGGTLPQRMPSCLSVFDRFLQSQDPVCCSLVRAKRAQDSGAGGKRTDLVKNISRILGIKDAESLAPTSSLSELGMDSLMGVEVKQTLERDYEVILSMQELRSLTVGDLIRISQGESNGSGSGSAGAGVELYIPSIEIPTEKFITMNSVPDSVPIFFLPPIEGSFVLLQKLAECIPRTCYGLNWTQEIAKFHKIDQVTEHYLKLVNELLPAKFDSSIDIVAYSFGSTVGFDMATKLQAAGRKVNLIFMDASPTYLSSSTAEFGSKTNSSEEDDSGIIQALLAFINQFVPVNYDQLLVELTALDNNELRFERIAELINNAAPSMDKALIIAAAKAFVAKIYMMHQYKISNKFHGDITLLRASERIFQVGEKVPEDYFVSDLVTGKCDLHVLNGNHQSFILQNLQQLSDLILKAF